MIRIVIVDDEPIERRALKQMVESGIPGVEIVGQAGNGQEAIDMAESLRPDLMTMDIRMPGINGIEAIEAIRKWNTSIKFIMVTAFEEFEFARKAIRLGVTDYLLKPSRVSVIVDTFQNVINEIRKEQEEQENILSQQEQLKQLSPIVEADIVRQLIFDYSHSIHLDEAISFIGLPNRNGMYALNIMLLEEDEEPELSTTSDRAEKLYKVLKSCFHETAKGWFGPMLRRQVPVIVFAEEGYSYRASAVSLMRKLLQAVRGIGHSDLFIGIGRLYDNMADIRFSYQEAIMASVDTTMPIRYVLYEDLQHVNLSEAEQAAAEAEKAILEEVRRGKWKSVSLRIEQLIDRYEILGLSLDAAQNRIHKMITAIMRISQEAGTHFKKSENQHHMHSYQQLKLESQVMFADLIAVSEKVVESEPSNLLMMKMKRYVTEHAHEDISLERIAEHLNLNSFYVSKLFKEQSGTNYIDFLTECRIDKAKQLMQDTDMSQKEITFEVGYHDPNYFSRVFKRQCGMSPSEYRKEIQQANHKFI